MEGVTFSIGGVSISSYGDWGLTFRSHPVISPPEPKTFYVDVPGSDGSLDLTESLTGYVTYKRREIKMEFNLMRDRADWEGFRSTITSFLHGREGNAIFSTDAGYYWRGRWEVGDVKYDKSTATITVSGLVEPYKYKALDTEVSVDVDGTTYKTIPIQSMPVVPTFTGIPVDDAELTLTWNGTAYSVAGQNIVIPSVVLTPENHVLTFGGEGTVTVTYTEGEL